MSDEALKASENRFKIAFFASPIAKAITTLDEGRYVDVNEAFERQMGYSRAEICGRTSIELEVWPTPAHREAIVARLQRSEPVQSERSQFRTKSGRLISTVYSAGLITLDGKRCILAAIADVTPQQEAEEALREHSALLQTLIVNSPYGIMMGGKDHRIRFCNPAFQRIFQYSQDEVVGSDPDDLIGLADSSEAQDISARVLGGELVHATAVRRRKDGTRVDVEFHAVPLIRNGEFVGCFGIYQDITQRIQGEAKLRALRDRLTRIQDDERAHIARELHDDIGQRLALLAIQLTQLQREAPDTPPELGRQLEASRRLAEEICVETQRISHRLHPTQLALLGVTKALSSLCAAFARQTNVSIDFACDDIPQLSPEVNTCLYRVAQEAIQNAAKHSRCDTIRVELRMTSDGVRLCVSDAGQGFDVKAAQKNAGLGLVSMAERARSVGGDLSVDSAVNRGTRIEVAIPTSRLQLLT